MDLLMNMLIAVSLIQSIDDTGFTFIPYICNVLLGINDKSSTCLLSA